MTEKNIKCSSCGNSDYCERCAAGPAEGAEHLCFECYKKQGKDVKDPEKMHVCIPPEELSKAYDQFLADVTERAFTELWNTEKKKLKELSKQEIAKTSFFEGARFMIEFMRRMSQEQESGKQQ